MSIGRFALMSQTPVHSPQPALDGYKQLSELASLLAARRFPQAWTLVCRSLSKLMLTSLS